jgi:hypothetical protein
MTTESEAKLARYGTVEKEADAFGRVIGVRRLKPSEQTKVAGMTSDVSGSDEIITPGGVKIMVPHRMPLSIAAAVCLIDDVRIPFPKSRGELDAIYDRLDAEGLTAAGAALVRLSDDEPEKPLDEAKN